MGDHDYQPAQRVQPDPEDPWEGYDPEAEATTTDADIDAAEGRTFDPLMPEDEKLFRVPEEADDGA